MKILGIRYTNKTTESLTFYQALGFQLASDDITDENWVELSGSTSIFALHSASVANSPMPEVELFFVAEKPLEDVQKDLVAAGFEPGAIVDEGFGPFLRVTDPSGLELRITGE